MSVSPCLITIYMRLKNNNIIECRCQQKLFALFQGVFRAFYRVLEQVDSRHQPYSAGYRSDLGNDRIAGFKIRVSAQLAFGIPVDADINDDGSSLEHVSGKESPSSHSHYDYVGSFCL